MNDKYEKVVCDLRTLHTIIVKACGHIQLTIDELSFASQYAADLDKIIKGLKK